MFISNVTECVNTIISMANVNSVKLDKGIEFFCGDGSIYTLTLAKYVNSMVGIDLSKEKGYVIQRSCPNLSYICSDSVEYAINIRQTAYDLISIDNPLCLYGDYCEHFELFPYIHKFVNDTKKTILAFDIVHKPYNENSIQNQPWIIRRQKYYNIKGVTLDLDYALDFYCKKLEQQGLLVSEIKYVCREWNDDNDYFYMIICVLEKRGKNHESCN